MALITTIIGSAGTIQRRDSIRRAINSVLQQTAVDVDVLVVLNGPNVSSDVYQDLLGMGVRIEQLERPSLPHALHHGRCSINSQYFCFLDDDDVYLPGGLQKKMARLEQDPNLDAVVTNGLITTGDQTRPLLPNDLDLEEGALLKLFDQNWLASCGGFFRSGTVGSEYFHVDAKYFEWTMTAFLLALDRRVEYLPELTFQVSDSPESLSKSLEYTEASPRIFGKMLQYDLPHEVKSLLHRRRIRALHAASTANLQAGKRAAAWRYHLRSLKALYGWQYLMYTRKLLIASNEPR